MLKQSNSFIKIKSGSVFRSCKIWSLYQRSITLFPFQVGSILCCDAKAVELIYKDQERERLLLMQDLESVPKMYHSFPFSSLIKQNLSFHVPVSKENKDSLFSLKFQVPVSEEYKDS